MNYARFIRSYRLFRLTNDTWEALHLAFLMERIEVERASAVPRLPPWALSPMNDLYGPDEGAFCVSPWKDLYGPGEGGLCDGSSA
jgi:hypothetical protein